MFGQLRPMRFRPEQHLRRQNDIRGVREGGQRIDCRAFTIWWKQRGAEADPVKPAPPARVCVIASTAAVGGATQRNRAKRRLREVFRQHQSEIPAGHDLLLIARAAANTWPMPELKKKFSDACRQIGSRAATPR